LQIRGSKLKNKATLLIEWLFKLLFIRKNKNMKKILVCVFVQLITVIVFAQADTTRIEQYCQIIATPRFLSNKVTIDIDFGEEKSFWADTRLRNYDGKLKKFNTIIDALNFMGKEGWIFINAYPVKIGDVERYHFGFRKHFSRSEVRSSHIKTLI
jgi:hypothetical protein